MLKEENNKDNLLNQLQQQKEEGNNVIPSQDYRIYADIGGENGTWMDRRWGTSGKPIEFTIDVSFLCKSADNDNNDMSLASLDIASNMVNDNNNWFFGDISSSAGSSAVRICRCSSTARLRGGFDHMNCSKGGYRIDFISNNSNNSVLSWVNASQYF